MTTTGGDNINLAPENDHNDDTLGGDNVDLDGHDDGTSDTTAQANVPAAPGGGNGPTNFNLWVEQNKIPEFFGAKSEDTISAVDFIWKISPKQIDGQMPRLITTSPIPSGTRHESGYHQLSTGTRTRTSGWSGQISRTYSSKNMQSKQMTN